MKIRYIKEYMNSIKKISNKYNKLMNIYKPIEMSESHSVNKFYIIKNNLKNDKDKTLKK